MSDSTEHEHRRHHLFHVSRATKLLIIGSATVILVVAAGRALTVIGTLVSAVLVPVLVAILFTCLLMPVQILLNHRLRLNRHLAAGLTLVLSLGLVVGVFYFAGAQLAGGFGELRDAVLTQIDELLAWVQNSGLPVDQSDLDNAVENATGWLQENQSSLLQGALSVGLGVTGFLVGFFLCLMGAFFFLAQGDKIWAWIIAAIPAARRERWYEGSRRAWVTVSTYTKMQVVIAAVDALGIGLGAWILGLPLVIPLIAITFLLCFIPVVGPFLSGAIAVVIALAFEGLGAALIMLLIVLAVQQLEGDVLSPILMGKAVKVHPVVVLFAIAGGSYTLGLLGALFAVPVVATINTVMKYADGRDPFPVLAEGGSALTDSARTLVGQIAESKLPKRVGEATPAWLMAARKASERGQDEPSRGDVVIAPAPGSDAALEDPDDAALQGSVMGSEPAAAEADRPDSDGAGQGRDA